MIKKVLYFIAAIGFTTLIGCQKDDPEIPFFPPEPPVEDISLKIWAHGVNDIATAQRKKGLFAGLELDLNYSQYQNQIFVGHDLCDTINNLTLFQWLSSLTSHDKSYYWLDMKNLSESNADSIVTIFLNCPNYFGINDKIIIEHTDHIALRKIKDAGLRVLLWTDNLFWSDIDTLAWKATVREKINYLQPNGISNYVNIYPALPNHFPDMDIYYWNTPIIGDDYEGNMELTKEILPRTQCKGSIG